MEKIAALEDAIYKKSLVGIYSVFYTIVHGDPNFSTGKFAETLRYVKSKNIDGLMQEFDGDEFEPEDKWDEEYWALIASSLIDNFCDTRIQHLEKVGKKVFPIKADPMSKPQNSDIYRVQAQDMRRKSVTPKTGTTHQTPRNRPTASTHRIPEEKKKEVKEKNHLKCKKKGKSLIQDIQTFFRAGKDN